LSPPSCNKRLLESSQRAKVHTGLHIAFEEREKIFEEGYRGSNISNKPGTGHGLTFIKNAIEMHGGMVGYETTQNGNKFYYFEIKFNRSC